MLIINNKLFYCIQITFVLLNLQIPDTLSGHLVYITTIIYTGSTTEIPSTTELGISGNVVQALVSPYLGKGRKLFVDNWYTSPRKHMPKLIFRKIV